MEVFEVEKMVLREGEVEKTKRQARDARETEKFWKIVWFLTLFLQNTCFLRLNWLANESPSKSSKSLEPRFWKSSLSLFHDWDFHSPMSYETLGVRSRLENESPKIFKLRFWKKILSLFRNWNFHSPMSHETLRLSLRLELETCNSRVSHQNEKLHIFGFLWNLFKSKYIPKTTKILKNIFGFDQQILEYVHHI